MTALSPLSDLFLLDPEVTFLNHGSFGACPKPVFEAYQQYQRELEREPVEFLGRRFADLMEKAREAIGQYMNVSRDSLVFVMNSTWGVNAVIRSLDFESGDEVLTTNHEYGACSMSWEWLLAKSDAHLVRREIPLPVRGLQETADHFWKGVTERTRVIYLSHITSSTALILPVKEICRRAREQGILTVIDGAHAPGQIDLDLKDIGADIYTGNFHKWLCAPKGAGFLYVRPQEQSWMESLIISWGWGRSGKIEPSSFVERNEWQGTRDISPFLTVPDAIAFQEQHDWPAQRQRCHELASQWRERMSELTGLPPVSPNEPAWFGQMAVAEVPTDDPQVLTRTLFDKYQIEIPGGRWEDRSFLRASFQAYNSEQDLDRLIAAVSKELNLRQAVVS